MGNGDNGALTGKWGRSWNKEICETWSDHHDLVNVHGVYWLPGTEIANSNTMSNKG